MKHWCVTEKGHTNTRRIHLHGIFYAPNGMTQFKLINILRNNWIETYRDWEILQRKNNKLRIKIHDKKRHGQSRIHRESAMLTRSRRRIRKTNREKTYRDWETKEDYYTKQGTLIALPKYYKYKLFTEEQREQLWIYREESGEKYIGNFKIKVKDEESEEYYNTLKKEHNAEGVKTHRDDIKEIIIKKLCPIVTGKQIGRAHV